MKLSVVIPIYGVEKYIARCVQSVLEQDYAAKELILVDDSSPDRSMAVVSSLLAQYPQTEVHIIHHPHNRGLAAARKTGIEAATGEYIVSVDGDDCLAPHALTEIAAKAVETQADIIRINAYFDWINTHRLYRGPWSSDAQTYCRYLLSGYTLPSMWLHVVKRSLYEQTGIYPTEGIDIGEDYLLMPRLCRMAHRIAYVDQGLYYYNQANSGSYMHRCSETYIRHLTQAMQALTVFFSDEIAFSDALHAGQWLKKTELMMRVARTDYDLVNAMPAPLPVCTTTLHFPQRIAARLIAKQRWNSLACYCRLYNDGMELIQTLKGRRRNRC